jgi:ribosomal-protein-alanine N-acetyltransferase
MKPIFETGRLVVCPFTEKDAAHFFALNGNADVMRYIRPVKTREETDAFLLANIQGYHSAPQYGRWGVWKKADANFVGSFALIPTEGLTTMQLGYSLLPEYWGRGYATELTLAALEYVFIQVNLDVIFAYTEPANVASQQVLIKCGFTPTDDRLENGKTISAFTMTKSHYQMISQRPLASLP